MRDRMVFIVIAVLMFFQGCSKPLEGLDALFPASKTILSWKWDGRPVHYSSETLYELINGEAELYNAYSFKNLSVLTYYSGSVEDTFLTVHIYDMSTPENAFGVYSSYRYPGYEFQTIGSEAMISDFGLKFYQGPYFVDITYGDMTESIQKAGLFIAKSISKQIPEVAEKPDVIRQLPKQQMLPYSIRYKAREMLNQSFMPAGVEAKYVMSTSEMTGFVVFFPNNEKATQALSGLKKFYVDDDAKLLKTRLPGEFGMAVETPYEGILFAVVQDQVIAGVREVENIEEGKELLQNIIENLQSQ